MGYGKDRENRWRHQKIIFVACIIATIVILVDFFLDKNNEVSLFNTFATSVCLIITYFCISINDDNEEAELALYEEDEIENEFKFKPAKI